MVSQDKSADVVLIGVDWGSSSLRAFLIGHDGLILATRSCSDGVSRLEKSEALFRQVLLNVIGDWLDCYPDARVMACGMIGSAHGWTEVPYVKAPAVASDLVRGTGRVYIDQQRCLEIIPGLLSDQWEHHAPDVMRGEETQIIGVDQQIGRQYQRYCVVLPGTHSKWALVENGKLSEFQTYMTGEMFALLSAHSVLARLMKTSDRFDDAAFRMGVLEARNTPISSLLHQLFSVRTRPLFAQLKQEAVADYLSGLLIANEIQSGLAWLRQIGNAGIPVCLVGDDLLNQRYQIVLELINQQRCDSYGNTAAAGLWQLAELQRSLL